MNRSIDFTQLGGLYVYQDTLDIMQSAYSENLAAIASIIGNKVILSGVIDTGSQAGDGWIVFNGEVLPFIGGAKLTYVNIEEVLSNEQFDDTVQRQVYKVRRLRFGNTIGPKGGFLYADLTRFAYNSADVKTSLNAIQTILKSVINFENEVILSGCTVSGVVGSNMQVSAGSVLFAGNLITSAVYNGSFPAFLKDNGTWDTVQPVSGLYIKFDPHTSQRYKDVLRRFNYQSGDILMSKVLSDRFDTSTGLGKWEWSGFKLSMDMRGRVPVGLWFGDNGGPNEYDATLRNMNYFEGARTHTLTIPQLPAHAHNIPGTNDGTPGTGGINFDGVNNASVPTSSVGDGEAHNNMQPYRVLAYIERI